MGTPSVSNVNPIGPNVGSLPTTRVNLLGLDISFLQLASPPPDLLADMSMIYQTPNGSLYQSNGTSLVGMNVGAARIAATTVIPLDTAGYGKAMPPIAGQTVSITADITPTIGAGTVLGGVTVADYLSSGVGNLVLTNFNARGDTFAAEAGRLFTVTYFYQTSGAFAIVQKGNLNLTTPGQVTSLILGVATTTTQPLTWTAPASNGGSALTDYFIEYQLAGAGSFTAFAHSASTVTAIVVNGLTASNSYNYRVSAVNAVGTGTASAVGTGSTAAAGTLALDSIATASIGAYSLNRRLRAAYAGSACVIRSSAGGNITVGFSGNTVDWATAMTALGANNAFLVTVFDQSGNVRDAVQATTSQQPQIATAGVVNKQASLYPASIGNNASSTGLVTAGFTLGTALGGATMYVAGGLLSNAGTYGVATMLAGPDTEDYASVNSFYLANSGLNAAAYFGTYTGMGAVISSGATSVICARYQQSGSSELWINGTAGAGGSGPIGSGLTAGAGNRLSFHSRIAGSVSAQPSNGNVSEVIYYPRLADVDRVAVESNLRTAYGV